MQLAGDHDSDIRFDAVLALCDNPTADMRDTFTAALTDEDAHTRRLALRGLARIEDPADTPTILRYIRDPEEDIRYEAMLSLVTRAAPEHHDVFVAGLAENDPHLRRLALQGLINLDDPSDTQRLIELALHDPDSDIRYKAVAGLFGRRSPELRAVFEKAAQDPDDDVRRLAQRALSDG